MTIRHIPLIFNVNLQIFHYIKDISKNYLFVSSKHHTIKFINNQFINQSLIHSIFPTLD